MTIGVVRAEWAGANYATKKDYKKGYVREEELKQPAGKWDVIMKLAEGFSAKQRLLVIAMICGGASLLAGIVAIIVQLCKTWGR